MSLGASRAATGKFEYRSDPERDVGYGVKWLPPGKELWRAGKACGMAVTEPEGEGICNRGGFPPMFNAHLQEMSTIRRNEFAHRRTLLLISLARSLLQPFVQLHIGRLRFGEGPSEEVRQT